MTSLLERVKHSEAFRSAKKRAEGYAKDLARLRRLVEEATQKAEAAPDGPLKEVRDLLMASFRMLKAHAKGDYTKIPLQSLLLIIASVVYFVVPFDLVPDFLPVVGFLDDAALLAWTLRAVRSDVDDFRVWESQGARGP